MFMKLEHLNPGGETSVVPDGSISAGPAAPFGVGARSQVFSALGIASELTFFRSLAGRMTSHCLPHERIQGTISSSELSIRVTSRSPLGSARVCYGPEAKADPVIRTEPN
jgi:hypothetical protein